MFDSIECPDVDACTAGLSAGACSGQCEKATDCAGTDTECRKRVCTEGTCEFAFLPSGAAVSTQVSGDCRRTVCDGAGATSVELDENDLPDDDNECTADACDGTTAVHDWMPLGTPCQGSGICNGAGVCGICEPGKGSCNGLIPRTCDANGQWQQGVECEFNCTAGSCGGACVTGEKDCDNAVPRECDANGVWVPGQACSYVCQLGECMGVCSPGDRDCVGNTPRECSAQGQWQDETACSGATPICLGEGDCGCPGNGGPTMKGLPGGYCIDTTEVTRQQYAEWLASNPSTAQQPPQCSFNTSFTPDAACIANAACKSGCALHPQVCVDWCDSQAYCASVGKRLCGAIAGGQTPPAQGNDASIDAWYAACSSGGWNQYPYEGSYQQGACAVQSQTFSTVEVGTLPECQSGLPSYAGVFDMVGNVEEWVDSCTATSGASDYCRVRGGAYHLEESFGVCTGGLSIARNSFSLGRGFRCCAP